MKRETPELDDLVMEIGGLNAIINAFAIQFLDCPEQLTNSQNADGLFFINKALDRIICDMDEIVREQNRKTFLETKKA